MPQRPINSPPLNFTPDAALWADKLLLRLEDMLPFCHPGYFEMPDTVEIVSAGIALQMGSDLPAGSRGNIWMSMATPDYVEMSGVPGSEKCAPFGLIPLVFLPMRPQADDARTRDHATPILYRKGLDRIFIGRELKGAQGLPLQSFVTICVKGDGPQWPARDSVTVWDVPLDGEASAPGVYWVRNQIPVTADGSLIAVCVAVGPSGGTINGVRVGVQASGPDMVAAPVTALCQGQVGFSLPANGEAWFAAPLAVTAGMNLLVEVGVSDHWGFRAVSPAPSWYSGTDSAGSATMRGAMTFMPSRSYAVDCVKVLA